jgi:hypothetical protein|tara:strand:- start:135 stop:461 length:327 start_codon:yes stop_codon:yes gene_type:complete
MEASFINFIPTAPKYSDAELDNALITEVLDQHKLKFHPKKEKAREIQSAKEAKEVTNRTVPGLGKLVATIPYEEFIFLRNKYGEETVLSPPFLKDYNKRFPHLSPNKA